VAVLVVDARAGVRPGDEEMADLCAARRFRASSLPTSATASPRCRWPASFIGSAWASRWRCPRRRASARETCSTRIVELLPAGEEQPDSDAVRLAVIGRPNVGKSSLVNSFLGEERVIVSELAGTTRDAIDMPLLVEGAPADPRGHRGHAPPVEGRGLGRVLHRPGAPAAPPNAPMSRWSCATPPTE